MRNILSYIFTPFHLLAFGFILVSFHPVQWLSLKIGGYKWHKAVVDIMNLLITKSLLFIGSICHFNGSNTLPLDKPLIFVSNHNSLYDIPPMIWFLRNYHAKFVSKIELGKGIPSVSFNLRHGGSVLIDRKDQRQSLKALKEFAEYLEHNNYSGVIFPEGTRGLKGQVKNFSPAGLKMLLKYAPSALVVPIAIKNTWKLNQFGKFPMSFGVSLHWDVLEPIEPSQIDPNSIASFIENKIRVHLNSVDD